MIIAIAIIALVGVTIQRHKVVGNIFESILNIVAGYFCCGPALLQVMLKNPVSSGISTWHWGQAIFGGLLGCINYILQIVTFKRVYLNLYDTQAYAAEFYAVGAHQSMNAYPTWYYYFMQDFGYLGVVLITAIIAGISVRIYRKAKREPSINNQLAYFYVLHVILFASVWWELRRSDIVATMLHNLWIMPLIGLKVRGKRMGKSRSANSVRNVSFGFAQQLITLVLAFVTRTIFVRKLGAEYTGVNGLYTNILTLLSLAELGIGNVLTYSLYGALHDNDHEKLKQLISYYRKLYRYIAAAVTVVGLAIVPFLGQLVKSTLPHNEVVLYYLLFLCNSVVSYFVMFKVTLLRADQKSISETLWRQSACYFSMYYRLPFYMLIIITQPI